MPKVRVRPNEGAIKKARGQDIAEARQDVRNRQAAMGANPSVRDLRDMVNSLFELVEILSDRIK